jgi:hypothetical protein
MHEIHPRNINNVWAWKIPGLLLVLRNYTAGNRYAPLKGKGPDYGSYIGIEGDTDKLNLPRLKAKDS